MKFFTVIVTLFLLFGKGSLQPNQVDIRIQNYVRIKFDGFRAWFVDHGHTEREHDFPGSRVINVSSTFYQLSSLLSEAKLHIYWPDLRTKSITSFSSRGSIMVEMDPSSDPNIIGNNICRHCQSSDSFHLNDHDVHSLDNIDDDHSNHAGANYVVTGTYNLDD
ncbi:uncharacterized protein LOC110857360 isoform X2 [Folsomia candida]|uniref:uncharacterized protein LOC110857360 isoform X2 n=1 Tax=Folsomia candida TaxID=158441 RepID=UPI00160539A4|nr:uncharacterized protein LOC110857360 isoform X2 [Folsomia candida]